MLKKLAIPVLLIFLFPFYGTAQPLSIFSVHFDTDIDTLNAQSRQTIIDELQAFLPPQDYRAHLIGHTDIRGSLAYNQALSERRAAAVEQRLQELGFEPGRIEADGKAYLDPAAEGDSEAAMARNRRVDIVIEKARWNVPSEYYSLDSKRPASLEYERSGTAISLPADAFTYPNGKEVEGDIVLMYREFRDPADFIASGLPMNFNRQGEDVYFNSTGMFEIRAYDKAGQALALRPGKKADIDFVQTQILEGTEFWRYDETANSWDSGDALIEYEEGETVRVQAGVENQLLGLLPIDWPKDWQWGRDRDTTTQLLRAYSMIPELLDGAAAYTYQYAPMLDPNLAKHRFLGREVRQNYAGIHYIGHLPFEDVYNDTKYYNIELRILQNNGNRLYITIEDLSGENPELAAFAGAVWELKVNDEELQGLPGLAGKYADFRISRSKKRRHYRLMLKYQDKLLSLDARLEQLHGEKPDKETLQDAYIKYSRALRERYDAFDQERKNTLAEINLIWPCMKLLLPKEVSAGPFQLQGMRIAIETNRKRGENAPQWPAAGSTSIRGAVLEDMPGYTFMATYARYFRGHLVGSLGGFADWRQLIRDYNPAVAGQVPIYAEVYRAFEQPRPRLHLKGMGVFNLDVLKYFEEEQRLLARFEDENGKLISHYRVDVVNHRLNGLLSFREPEIILDLKAPITLIVYSEDGKLYLVPAEQMQQLGLQGQPSYTFRAVDALDYSGQPDVLREMLGG